MNEPVSDPFPVPAAAPAHADGPPAGDAGLIFLSCVPRERRLISQNACRHTQGIAGGVPILALVLRRVGEFSPARILFSESDSTERRR